LGGDEYWKAKGAFYLEKSSFSAINFTPSQTADLGQNYSCRLTNAQEGCFYLFNSFARVVVA